MSEFFIAEFILQQRRIEAQWSGGAYIELWFGGYDLICEVINVWDDEHDTVDERVADLRYLLLEEAETPVRHRGFDEIILEWVAANDEENPGWYEQYLSNTMF